MLSRYIYPYGLRLGLPFSVLHQLVDLTEKSGHIAGSLRRRRTARAILADSPWRGFVPRQTGCRMVAPGEIAEVGELARAGRAIFEARRDQLAEQKPRGNNPFYVLLSKDDGPSLTELAKIGASRTLTEIVSDYFGSVPRLEYANVWLTRPNLSPDGHFNSQLWHLDKLEDGILTLFVNVFDVAEENGPFDFLPADMSLDVRRKTAYERRAVFGDGRLSDEQVFAACPREEMASLAGPAGSGGFVDTSVCLHRGSRCREGERVVVVLRYMPAFRRPSGFLNGVALPDGRAGEVERLLLDKDAGTVAGATIQ